MRIYSFILLLAYSGLVVAQSPTQASNQSAKPACNSDNHKAFDFWLGEWRVTTPDGEHAGDNTIEKIQGGCVLKESWRSATSAFTGTSFNFFNQRTQQWEQLWLDNQGSSLHMRGQSEPDKMVLRSDSYQNKAGQSAYNQITWTANDDGSVRQHWVLITEGADDQTIFDGLYQKQK